MSLLQDIEYLVSIVSAHFFNFNNFLKNFIEV